MIGSHRLARHPARLRYPVGAVVIGGVVAVVTVLAAGASNGDPPGHPTRAAAVGTPAPRPASSTLRVIGAAPPTEATAAPDVPVRVRIPAIGVDSRLQALGLLADGSLQPPTKWGVAGWYADGIVPGQVGPAVIAGHVDSTSGPAVFFRLRQMRVGDRVVVDARDGARSTFVVDRIQRFPKAHFPTEDVYGAVPDAELRLVTCTGAFDAKAHSYLDNLVVSAHLI